MLSKVRERTVRRLLAASADILEPLWRIIFQFAGYIGRGSIPILESEGGKSILVLAPHPDDEIACAGTSRLHKQSGDEVRVCIVTDGRLAASPWPAAELAERRRREASCVVSALNLDRLYWMGFEEGSFWVMPFVKRLKEILENFRPDVIYSPSRLDFHPDHHRTAFSLAKALLETDFSPVVRVYQMHVPLTAVTTNVLADVTGEAEAVRAAIGCYESQWWHLGRTQRMRRYAAHYYGRGRYCEPFWQMSAGDFCALHGETDGFDQDEKIWSLTDFSGMRYFSWRDPVAFLKGRGKRRELVRKVFM